ncbi:MAG: BPL-N domain-containing protein [bacterium]
MQEWAHRLRIGIYVGEGASHSWTWFVDLLERFSYSRIRFLSEEDFGRALPCLDVLMLSGGDTFAVARALERSGPEALRSFLERGGLYIGSCAGAYLPLHSSKDHLRSFNFVRGRINNLSRDLPQALALPAKLSTSYGCAYVIHPVREEVVVRMSEGFPVWGGKDVRVPLYGGPPLRPSDDFVPFAFYSGFTDRTLFLTERELAGRVYLGQVAACEKAIGDGRMVLLGPHFEHPGFPEGNAIVDEWMRWHVARSRPRRPAGADGTAETDGASGRSEARLTARALDALKKEVSNMRIRAAALAREEISWQIGAKVYEPEKMLHFVEAVWTRLAPLKPRNGGGPVREHETGDRLLDLAASCHAGVRDLSARITGGEETRDSAEAVLCGLRRFTAAFLECYFSFMTNRGFR